MSEHGSAAVESMFGLLFVGIGAIAFISACIFAIRVLMFMPVSGAARDAASSYASQISDVTIDDFNPASQEIRQISVSASFPQILGWEFFSRDILMKQIVVPVLPPLMKDDELQGGDMPSFFCEAEGGYKRCDL